MTSYIDFAGICNALRLHWLKYEESSPGQAGNEKRETRVMFFIHERGEETGLKFVRRADMEQAIAMYSVRRLFDSETSLVAWGGKRGHRIATTMSEESKAEVRRAQEALASMKEASVAGEMANVEAGVGPVTVRL